MPKFNDFDLTWENWKKYEDILTGSLWVIPERGKSWKHSNFYHENFIPQIPNQLIQRYTKKNDIVLEYNAYWGLDFKHKWPEKVSGKILIPVLKLK